MSDAATSDAGAKVAAIIAHGFLAYRDRFAAITAGAAPRFAGRDWSGMLAAPAERLDAYAACVDTVVGEVRTTLGDRLAEHAVWAAAKEGYTPTVDGRPDRELAETFFNSITRRIFHTEGIDPEIEYVSSPPGPGRQAGQGGADVVGFAGTEADLAGHLSGLAWEAPWVNLERDVMLAVAEIGRRFELLGVLDVVGHIELLSEPFYRGQGAYLVGRARAGATWLALALVVHHTARGLTLGAVLAEGDDLSVLFSYTRASFLVRTACPAATVAYLGELMPHKRPAELYTTIGFHKHGKTELYRDFMRHVAAGEDRFEHARGIKGMVMMVFTMPGYDVVFKVIRDRFPYPKQTTRRQIMAKYAMVFRHDRAGRMIEAYEFEHLRFARGRFGDDLLAELAAEASRTVSVGGDEVTLHHVYVERRVTPLDIYVREANPIKAQAAIVDYGRAIKNLAATNIFPGDMLLKNFGVTRSGRVVFYDYDEITLLTDCNFREIPDTTAPDQEMAADPWFGVGGADIFPEEFVRFLGIRSELRDVFDYHHSDLFTVRFWRRAQERVRTGEAIEIFPYRRSRRLGASARSRLGAFE
jgi:isocitrate dehydrogenase kinase/phosphatase